MKRSTAWCSVLASTVLLITGTFAIAASAGVQEILRRESDDRRNISLETSSTARTAPT